MCAVTRLKAAHSDLVAGFERLASEAAACKGIDAKQFDRPLGSVAFIVYSFQMHPGVRVGPFDCRYRTGDLDRACNIELCRKRMMRKRLSRAEDERESGPR